MARMNIDKDDYIRSLNANAGYFFAGTQRGTLYMFESDSSKPAWKHELFNGLGSIDFIRHIRMTNSLWALLPVPILSTQEKNESWTRFPSKPFSMWELIRAAFTWPRRSACMCTQPETARRQKQWLAIKQAQFPFYNWAANGPDAYLLFPQRTRSIRFDSLQQQVYAATKNGLFEGEPEGISPFLITERRYMLHPFRTKHIALHCYRNDGCGSLIKEA
jgi:hypothetical protein